MTFLCILGLVKRGGLILIALVVIFKFWRSLNIVCVENLLKGGECWARSLVLRHMCCLEISLVLKRGSTPPSPPTSILVILFFKCNLVIFLYLSFCITFGMRDAILNLRVATIVARFFG